MVSVHRQMKVGHIQISVFSMKTLYYTTWAFWWIDQFFNIDMKTYVMIKLETPKQEEEIIYT
jgi:hypothetical protein